MSYKNYHSFYLTLIQKILKASFVGWVEEKGNKSLKIVKDKVVKELPFPNNAEITEETYKDLIDKLVPNEARNTI